MRVIFWQAVAQLARLLAEAAARRLDGPVDVAQAVDYAWPRAHGLLWDLQVNVAHVRWLTSKGQHKVADARLAKIADRLEDEVVALSEQELMR